MTYFEQQISNRIGGQATKNVRQQAGNQAANRVNTYAWDLLKYNIKVPIERYFDDLVSNPGGIGWDIWHRSRH